ncbi:DNA polymerase subunit alpha B [Nannizzia gypsea CBS 118893]|uniref:DNA polymerase alpha subunit B n=1 Tax=Arthroderma gypseum (strain ATCC MYA-4604 / CBS 118893) TaxID=535722 RepID=E4V3S7_ARTGP|nr:DNA polymerase subunit alpha B [Nannizzia gypsea CBS 118893]EFR04651.1 DNA polymerase subunit alpha B [Nannizzia gypsea CBS 118893]
MAEPTEQLNELFGGSFPDGLPQDVLGELLSILQLHAIDPQELFYKWESYCLKMAGEETVLNLDTVRSFKRNLHDAIERESRAKTQMRGTEKRNTGTAAPRPAAGGNQGIFDMLDDFAPNTPKRTASGSTGSSVKRKAFDTPTNSRFHKGAKLDSPGSVKTPSRTADGASNGTSSTPFSARQNSGQVIETLNPDMNMASAPLAPYSDPRIKLTANTDIRKFSYKPMAMKLSEASEILDDRIDEFMAIVQKHHKLEDSAFGNAAQQSTREVIAVGRIASDSPEGRLNTASIVLETSRRTGAGLRVPLKIDKLQHINFFPGQIVALRGINASGEYFTVFDTLAIPLLPLPVSLPAEVEATNEKLDSFGDQPLNYIFAAGPYTTDDNLAFEALNTLCEKAAEECADALILTGPFIDLEHPLIASGDFDLPELKGLDPDTATLATLFKHCISRPLTQLASKVPNINIILIPSVRDAVSKHISWPQEILPKRELGLPPKQAKVVTNPVAISLNEIMVGLCASDTLYELRREEVVSGRPSESDLLSRLPRYLIEQRHFSPVFPPTARENLPKSGVEENLQIGSMLDTTYLKLGDWWKARPDILITPSVLPGFVKVVESVVVINPGKLSKRRSPGTYAQIAVHPKKLTEEERESKFVGHRVYERARVDIIRI